MPEVLGRTYTRAELLQRIGGIEQVGSVRLVTLSDGVERGVRVLEFRTGTGFEFDLLVDRGFDIGRCEHAGRALGWQSGVGFTGPWYFEPYELGFLRSFGGGLLTTCGLDHALGPAEDSAANFRYPFKTKEVYGQHGRVSNGPARLVGYGERWEGDQCILWAEGEVLQAAVFGEHLLLRRRVEARLGESRLHIQDVVENVGYAVTSHMYLYHVNVGFPVLDEGSELLVPSRSATPVGDYPPDGYRTMQRPQRDFVEQVFDHNIVPSADGTVSVALVNRALGLGAYEIYRHDQLPHHFVWRMLGQGTYVVGIEPSTNRPEGRLQARERGELIELVPGEQRHYQLELGALLGAEAIDAFAAGVQVALSS
jgi:hypothetical protein